MRPHLLYLRLVLLHKLYVFVAGLAIGPPDSIEYGRWSWLRTLRWWGRLAMHDLSKFRPSEWRPYVAYLYSPEGKRAPVAFNRARLLHQHRSAHHWQYWILREESGKTITLLPEAWVVHEMVADWIGAGTKVLAWPTLAEAVAMTVQWYAAHRDQLVLREQARNRAEELLHSLAYQYGLVAMAMEVRAAQETRASLTVAR